MVFASTATSTKYFAFKYSKFDYIVSYVDLVVVLTLVMAYIRFVVVDCDTLMCAVLVVIEL